MYKIVAREVKNTPSTRVYTLYEDSYGMAIPWMNHKQIEKILFLKGIELDGITYDDGLGNITVGTSSILTKEVFNLIKTYV